MHTIYDPHYYKVVFCSSAPIGVPFLEKLQADPRFEVTGVVTMPDAPAGRGMKMQDNVVKIKAKALQGENNISKVVLIHGKDTNPTEKWYPSFIQDMKEKDIPIFAPTLAKPNDPILQEWIQAIEKTNPDENTILI